MKKVTLLIAMAALAVFAGCKKDTETKGTTLKASIEQNHSDSKTSLVPISDTEAEIRWTAGDKIVVNNGTASQTFTLTNGAGDKTGTFSYSGDYTFGESNVAVYPETATISGTTVSLTLPETQTFTATGTFGNGANPMLGTFADPEALTFASLCGGLGISLTGDNVAITAIEIVSNNADEKLNGTFVANSNDLNPVLAYSEGGTNRVRLNFPSAITLTTEAQDFYIVLPVGTLASGFTLNVYNGTDLIFIKTTTTDLAVALNTVKKMDLLNVVVPTVTTVSATVTSGTTAAGHVIFNGTATVTETGLCWGTTDSPTVNPTAANFAAASGQTANTDYAVTIEGLEAMQTYYIRGYAKMGDMYYYASSSISINTSYVDLGLPSGLLWATCNIGSTTPEGSGNYYAWGETTTKDNYSWSNYQYGSTWTALIKYCNDSQYGYNGFTDTLTILESIDDAAVVNWGNGWRMPTSADYEELKTNTTQTWTTQNGKAGRLFTASNGNSIFLPAAGFYTENTLSEFNSEGHYYSSSLVTSYAYDAWSCAFDSSDIVITYQPRIYGKNVRPVRSAE